MNEITPEQAKALKAALQPLVDLAFDPYRADYPAFRALAVAGKIRLHIAAIVSSRSLEVIVASVDEAGEATPIAARTFDGGGLVVTSKGASFN